MEENFINDMLKNSLKSIITEKVEQEMDKYSVNVLLEIAIKLERERIDKLIDMEIARRTKTSEQN